MKVTYLKLENVAGLVVGSNLDSFEIDFTKSTNKIIAIVSSNSTGKSVLLSSIHPFSGVCTLDERSTLPYIVVGKNGYKEIHYANGLDEYIIKHYFKANRDTHSVKSYFMKNGVELNENGNVTSFNALVETHFGLTQEMMRLIRIGSNVSSFISLSPAKRKEYIGKLIEEIDLYIQIYKKINDDIRVVKTMLQANNTSLRNCHITDINVEEDSLSSLGKDIKKYERERDEIISQISSIDSLMKHNDIDKLRSQKIEAESSISEYNSLKRDVEDNKIGDTQLDDLIEDRNKLLNTRVDIQAKINSFRLAIDQLSTQIERLDVNLKKVSSNNDLNSLTNAIDRIKEAINNTPNMIKDMVVGESSDNVYKILIRMQSLNQISKMIIAFGNKPIEIYYKLYSEKKSVETWLQKQIKSKESSIKKDDLQTLLNIVFEEDMIIMPNCDTEFHDCPYYRLNDSIKNMKEKMDDKLYDNETLNHIKIISDNVALVFNVIDDLGTMSIPAKLKDEYSYKNAIKRLNDHLPFFDLHYLEEYLGIVKDSEIYRQNLLTLKDYEHRLMMYHKSGVESIVEEINQHKQEISSYSENIQSLQTDLKNVNAEISKVDSLITLLAKFNDLKKYKKQFESTLEHVAKLLAPLETANSERKELDFKLRNMTNLIASCREQQRLLEAKINNYNRLIEEEKVLSKKNRDLTMILDAVSTKKGIPVFYMKKYLVLI